MITSIQYQSDNRNIHPNFSIFSTKHTTLILVSTCLYAIPISMLCVLRKILKD